MHKRTMLAKSLLIAFSGSAALGVSPAMAQQSTQELQRVTVTGSNIKRTDTETASPVQTITRSEIERTGKTNIAEVLQGISANNSGSIPLAFSNGFAHGSTGVSLRGLGVNSTLVLVNGRRMASYGLADDGQRSFVDLNTIPLEVVDRIEVLKDGASAIYGSDAIAGVVNVILRSDYKGLTIAGDAGTSYKSDGSVGRLAATYGLGDLSADKYNVFVSAEYSKTKAIQQNTRPSYIGTNKLDTEPKTFGYYDQRTGGINPVTGLPLRGSPYGSIRNPANNVYQPATACPEVSSITGLCLTDISDHIQIQPEVERANVFGRGTWNLAADLQAYAEAGVFYTHTKAKGTPTPVSANWGVLATNSVESTATIALPVGHPQNPFAAAARIRGVTENLGGRDSDSENTAIRVIGGIKGSAVGWDYDTALGYIQTKLKDSNTGYVRNSVLQEGLASGQFRLGLAPMDAAYAARLSPTLEREPKNSISFADFKATRELFALPGGNLGISLGAEVRREKSDTPALPYTYEGDIVGLGYSGFNAARTVYAFFGEVSAPVLKILELNAAVRYDHYSDYGSSTTPKVGFKLTPIDWVAIRGTYAEGFRAPGPAENGNSQSAGYAGYLQVSNGNPNIQPEKSKSYTLGLVLSPTKDTDVIIDWYKVKRKNEIIGADGTLVVGADQSSGVPLSTVPGQLQNSRIIYDENGDIAAIFAPYINATSTTTTGVDLEVKQRIALGEAGKLTAGLNWTHINKFARKINGDTYEFAGTHGPYVLSSAAGTPRDKLVFDLTWDRGPLSATVRANYVSGMKAIDHTNAPYDPLVTGELANIPDGVTSVCGAYFPDGRPAPGGCRISSFTTFDIFGRWAVTKQLSVSASVTNALNRLAPWDPYTYGGVNYDPAYHQDGAVGRYFKLGARYTF